MKAKQLDNISKFISLILRHRPDTIGISLDEHGWANVNELVTNIAKQYNGFGMSELEEIVRTDNKQRYSFNEDKTLIRANQGHSIPVNVDLKEVQPPDILYHGTATRFVPSILEEGILSRTRIYVHLSQDIETAMTVGSRHGKPYVFTIDTKQMYEDGYKFYLSENNIYLTKIIPTKYL